MRLERGNNGEKKNILGKIKRLMTVTETDVLKEQEAERKTLREAVPDVGAEFSEDVTPTQSSVGYSGNTEDNGANQEADEKKSRKPFLRIVDSDYHFGEQNEYGRGEPAVENEDEVELVGKHERVSQEKVRRSGISDKKEGEVRSDEDDDGFSQDYDYEDEEDDEEQKPYKKAKSLFNSLFKLGQALNAKPDEFISDDEIYELKRTHEGNKQSGRRSNKNKDSREDEGLKDSGGDAKVSDTYISDTEKERKTIKAPPPIENIDMSFATVKKVNGNIFIEDNIEPMYTLETARETFNVEIGKLYPIILDAYEAYLEPEIRKAKKEAEKAKKRSEELDDDIITEATTVFAAAKEQSKAAAKIPRFAEEESSKNAEIPEKSGQQGGIKDNDIFASFGDEKKKKFRGFRKKEKSKNPKAERRNRQVKERFFSGYSTAMDYSTLPSDENSYETIEDYEVPQDARAVMVEINMNIRKLFFRIILSSVIFVTVLVITVLQKFFSTQFAELVPNIEMVYCTLNLILLCAGVGVCFGSFKNGLAPLVFFKGNSDTSVSVAAMACLIQCMAAFFDSSSFYNGTQGLYVVLVLFAVTMSCLGKLVMMLRIKENFRFIAQDRKKYAATILNDKKNAEKMIRGTNSSSPYIAYQRKTDFYKNFLKLSYAKDPSENMAAQFSIWGLVCSVAVAVVHGILYRSVIGAFSSFAMVSCLSIPVVCMLAVNLPMKLLCRKALLNDAMIVGYPAVKQFVDTEAVMVDSRELYPRSSIKLVDLKPFVPDEILESSLLNAAAVLSVANTSLTYVFSEVIDKKNDALPFVDSVKFEENKGIVGWIGGERVLIGRSELMRKYGIEVIPEEKIGMLNDFEKITYIANSGRLIAMIKVSYSPDKKIKNEIRRLQENGVSVLVRTADPNITAKVIVRDYLLHENSVKILPNSLGKIYKEAVYEKNKRARCYIGTRGKFYSLARAVSGCIRIKYNITTAVIVQTVGVGMGVLVASVVALLSGEQGMGAFELLCFMIFWAAASVIAPLVRKL